MSDWIRIKGFLNEQAGRRPARQAGTFPLIHRRQAHNRKSNRFTFET